MRDDTNEFAVLAERVAQGDPEARMQLRDDLDATLPWIVRRVLRLKRPTSPMDRWILGEVSRVDRSSTNLQEHLDRQVAQRLRDIILETLRPGAKVHPQKETLCNYLLGTHLCRRS